MKLLVWNIEKFTLGKLEDCYKETGGQFTKRRKFCDATDRLFYMMNVVTGAGTPANCPEVIAILEVLADPTTALGQPLDTQYSEGITEFLDYVKYWTRNDDWRLVPPLKCNPANAAASPNVAHEVVGVLYDNNRLQFMGPDLWPAAYPAPWNDANITDGTLHSGRIRFYTAAGHEIVFPANYHRRPFMVDFRERYGAGRLIRCLFSHTSPGFHVGGTQSIADIPAMAPAVGGGVPDFCVSAGDFNVNEWNAAQSAASYNPILALNYQKQFNIGNQRSTHFKRKKEATPIAPVAPFGYMGREIIDNFLIRMTAAGVAPLYRGVVINAVAGSPPPYHTVMATDLATLTANPHTVANFRLWENFWSIVSTSDHTPIFLEIP